MSYSTFTHDLKFLKNLSVLYVEDDPFVASQTVALLEPLFQKVYLCTNAEDALKLFDLEVIHLLIADIALPGMSGLELCETVRKKDRTFPIFITSSHTQTETLKQAIRLNLVDYLIKPVSIATLTQALRESLERMEQNGLLSVRLMGGCLYYPILGKIEFDNQSLPLTRTESELLNLLLRYKNQVVERSTIEYVIFPEDPISDAAYKNMIYRLRKKIGKESLIALSGSGLKLPIAQ